MAKKVASTKKMQKKVHSMFTKGSFEGQKNPINYSNPIAIVQSAGPLKSKILWQAQNAFKIPFFPTENLFFPIFIFIDKCLKVKEIDYLIHYVKFEMLSSLILSKFPPFSKGTSNWVIAFINSLLDSKLELLNAGLRLYFKLFANSQEN